MAAAPALELDALRIVLADAAPATLAVCACVCRELWAAAKGIAGARASTLLLALGGGSLPLSDELPAADLLFVLSAAECRSGVMPRGLMAAAAATELLQHALRRTAVPVPRCSAGGVLHVSIGAEHVLCTTSAGRVFACGSGRHGRLGYRPDNPQLWQDGFREVEIPAPKGRRVFVVKADAGGRHSVALDCQGRAYTWGFGRRGRLGHGDGRTYYAPHRVTFRAGPDSSGECRPEQEPEQEQEEEQEASVLRLVDVSAGGAHTLFVAASGDVYSCGVGGDGRLGLGHSGRALRPAHILSLALAGVRIVACTAGGGLNEGPGQRECGAHSVFLTAAGSCWACGCVGNGRLGLRTRVFSRKGYGAFSRTCYSWSSPLGSVNQMIPSQMTAWSAAAAEDGAGPPQRVKQVVAGERSTLLLCEDGTLLSFGMSLRGRKTACAVASENFLRTFDGVERVEGMDGDLHGVPPHCLVPYGGHPEEPFTEQPMLTMIQQQQHPVTRAGTAAASAGADRREESCGSTAARDGADGQEGTASGAAVRLLAVFEARGWLYVRGQRIDGSGAAQWWRKREDAGAAGWEALAHTCT